MIRMSPAQREEMRRSAGHPNRFWNEKVWTLLVADALDQSASQQAAVSTMCPGQVGPITDVWFEAQPLSPRKGKSGATEGNTRLDLAFGHVQQRGATASGIELGQSAPDSWICFVEAKCLSDCSSDVSYDPFRNQLTRVIENLLCVGNGPGPDKLYFTLLTPRAFTPSEHGQHSRLYGYKMLEYQQGLAQKDPTLLLRDLKQCTFDMRHKANALDSVEFRSRLDRLVLTWADFESLLELGPLPGATAKLDLARAPKAWDPRDRTIEIVNRLEAEGGTSHTAP